MSSITIHDKLGGSVLFSGPQAVEVFRCTALAAGLRMYDRHKMIPNRAYTPTRMLSTASSITGKGYKRGEYEQAARDLLAKADELKSKLTIVKVEE